MSENRANILRKATPESKYTGPVGTARLLGRRVGGMLGNAANKIRNRPADIEDEVRESQIRRR